MIQLATDPAASRMDWHTAQAQDKDANVQSRRGRPAHPWPFISRYTGKPAAQQIVRPAATEHGS